MARLVAYHVEGQGRGGMPGDLPKTGKSCRICLSRLPRGGKNGVRSPISARAAGALRDDSGIHRFRVRRRSSRPSDCPSGFVDKHSATKPELFP